MAFSWKPYSLGLKERISNQFLILHLLFKENFFFSVSKLSRASTNVSLLSMAVKIGCVELTHYFSPGAVYSNNQWGT